MHCWLLTPKKGLVMLHREKEDTLGFFGGFLSPGESPVDGAKRLFKETTAGIFFAPTVNQLIEHAVSHHRYFAHRLALPNDKVAWSIHILLDDPVSQKQSKLDAAMVKAKATDRLVIVV